MRQSWDFSIKEELHQVDQEIRRSIQSEQPILTEICDYVISSGGKRMRPGVTILSYLANGGKAVSDVVKIAAAFEMIHSATLIHDDINDRSEMRRGKPSAFKRFGLQEALISGDFLFVKAFSIGGFFNEEIVNMVADACTAIAEGEIVQFEQEGEISSLDVYLDIIRGKTAKPIMAGARIGAYLAKAEPHAIQDMGEYGLNIGMAFQIVDDILDIVGTEQMLGKPRMVDFSERKATMPMILAMGDGEMGKRLTELFNKDHKTHGDVEEAAELVCRTTALDISRTKAQEYADLAVRALKEVPDSIHKEGLRKLASTVVTRSN